MPQNPWIDVVRRAGSYHGGEPASPRDPSRDMASILAGNEATADVDAFIAQHPSVHAARKALLSCASEADVELTQGRALAIAMAVHGLDSVSESMVQAFAEAGAMASGGAVGGLSDEDSDESDDQLRDFPEISVVDTDAPSDSTPPTVNTSGATTPARRPKPESESSPMSPASTFANSEDWPPSTVAPLRNEAKELKRSRRKAQRIIQQQCRERLFSKHQDIHLQLHRQGTVNRKLFTAHKLDYGGGLETALRPMSSGSNPGFLSASGSQPNSTTRRSSARASLKDIKEGPVKTNEVAFRWIDVTGQFRSGKGDHQQGHAKRSSDGTGGRSAGGFADLDHQRSSTSQPPSAGSRMSTIQGRVSSWFRQADLTSENGSIALNNNPADAADTTGLLTREDSVFSNGYGSAVQTTYGMSDAPAVESEGALTKDALEQVLDRLESEFQIALPLKEVVRRAQNPDAGGNINYSDDTQTEWERAVEKSVAMHHVTARSLGEELVRSRLEERGIDPFRESPGSSVNKRTSNGLDSDPASFRSSGATSPVAPGADSYSYDSQHIFIFDSARSFIANGQSSILPPEGSAQRRKMQRDSADFLVLALDAFLQTRKGRQQVFESRGSAAWVYYVDTRRKLIVTVRPDDAHSVGRIRHGWSECFSKVSFDTFVWLMVSAAIENFKAYLDDMYAILDECETLIAPSHLDEVMRKAGLGGGSSGTEQAKRTTYGVRGGRRNTQFRADQWNADEDFGVSNASFGYGGALSGFSFSSPMFMSRSRCPKVKQALVKGLAMAKHQYNELTKKRHIPQDLTIAALRLQNMVYRQASVYFRSLGRSRHTMGRVAGALRKTDLAEAVLRAPTFIANPSRQRKARQPGPTSGLLKLGHKGIRGGTFGALFDDSSSDDDDSLLSDLGCGSSDVNFKPLTTESHDPLSLCTDLMERCRSTKRQASEMMNMNIAISTDFYDQNVEILALVSTIFVPLGFFATHWGMNYQNPTSLPEFSDENGYWIAWGVFTGVAILCALLFKYIRAR